MKEKPGRKLYKRGWQFKKKYNLTLNNHFLLYIHQNGCCAICKNAVPLNKMDVDHNHEINQVRGLLCRSCNLVLGKVKENIQTLRNAIKYLQQ